MYISLLKQVGCVLHCHFLCPKCIMLSCLNLIKPFACPTIWCVLCFTSPCVVRCVLCFISPCIVWCVLYICVVFPTVSRLLLFFRTLRKRCGNVMVIAYQATCDWWLLHAYSFKVDEVEGHVMHEYFKNVSTMRWLSDFWLQMTQESFLWYIWSACDVSYCHALLHLIQNIKQPPPSDILDCPNNWTASHTTNKSFFFEPVHFHYG